jgi:ABC-type branched-subunit amino acid transport system substrate-binding protein
VSTKKLFAAALSLAAFALSSPAAAEDGVTATEIVIGMANALTGPAAGLGTHLKAGSEAYLNKVNAAGGVHGRRIRLVSLDDGYEPARAAAATQKLIEQEKVFALFDYVGTPTSAAAVPIASKASVPYLFPFTGAEFLRNPVNKWVFNVRSSYFDETEAMVERLTRDLGIRKVALFIQDDAFGEAGKAGVNRALHKRDMKVVAEARFKRNTVEVDEGLAALKAAAPEAVVIIGPYKPVAEIVKRARASGFNPKFLTVSFVGTENLLKEVGSDGDGMYITQVVPAPEDGSMKIVSQYQSDMAGGSLNYSTLEGYVNAVVLVEALRKAGKDLTRASFMAALQQLRMDLGGIEVAFSPSKQQGLSKVWLTQVKGGRAVPVTKF